MKKKTEGGKDKRKYFKNWETRQKMTKLKREEKFE
jgi:hypothetical protein